MLSLLKDGTHGTHQDAEEGPYLLSAKNIKNGQIIIDDSSDRKISEDEFNQIHTKFTLENGDILLTIVGSIGESAILENVGKFTFQRSVAFLRPSEEMTSRFLKTEIESVQFQKELNDRKSQSAQPGVYLGDLSKIPIYITSKEEQKKIGECFSNLDHLITLHQRKYLQEKKTSLTWEQCKLEDVMDTVTDYVAAGSFEDIRNNVTYLNEPGYAQLVRTVDLKKKFTNNDSVYVDESAFKYLWRVNLNDECIVLPNIGANIGEVYFVEPSGLPYDNNVLGPNAILLKANEDTYFAFTALNNLTFQKQLFENVGSSGQPKFNKTELKSIQLYMPQNEEQVKIGQYFRQLDHLITLHRRAHFHRRRRTYK